MAVLYFAVIRSFFHFQFHLYFVHGRYCLQIRLGLVLVNE